MPMGMLFLTMSGFLIWSIPTGTNQKKFFLGGKETLIGPYIFGNV